MKFYQETTDWKRSKTPNHIYLLDANKSKMIGYVPVGNKKVFIFKQPLSFDVRGRKFKEVPNTFGYKFPKEKTLHPTWKVKGSRGDVYTVENTENGLTCTCQGFKFRSQCRHITEIDKKVK